MSEVVHVLSWTLVHAVWQVALIAAVVLWLARRTPDPAQRHTLALAGIACSIALMATTAATATVAAGGESAAAPAISSWVTAIDRVGAWLVAAWLCGGAISLLRTAGGTFRVVRLARRAVDAAGWQPSLDRLRADLGVRGRVELKSSNHLDVPAVIGWRRPAVLVPIAAFGRLSREQLELIIAHELVHVRRRDFAVNLAVAVAEAALFFHPAFHRLARLVRVERERCCDDVVVDRFGAPVEYATALLAVETNRARRPVTAIAATSGALLPRVQRILRDRRERRPRPCALAWSALAIVATAAGHLTHAPGLPVEPASTQKPRMFITKPSGFWRTRPTGLTKPTGFTRPRGFTRPTGHTDR